MNNMTPKEKAKQLFKRHGYTSSNRIANAMLDANLPEFNQNKIDFWLDVKNDLKLIND